jgi:hypothetical protein
VKDNPVSLETMCGQHVDPPNVVDFLDRDYYYKQVATEIPHDAGLEAIPHDI